MEPRLYDDCKMCWWCVDSRPSSAAGKLVSDRSRGASADNAPLWSTVTISDKEYKIDLKVIEPYKRVLSHGGQPIISVRWLQ